MTKNEKEKKNEIYVTISSKVGWMQVNWNQSYSFAKKKQNSHTKSLSADSRLNLRNWKWVTLRWHNQLRHNMMNNNVICVHI